MSNQRLKEHRSTQEMGHWAAESKRLGEFERCQITHRDPETVTASAGRAPAGHSSDNKSPPPRVERYFYEVQWPPISSTKSLVIVNLPLPRVLPPNGKMILRGPVAA